MKIEVFKELQPYTLMELESILGMDDDDVRELLRTLSLMNVVKRISNNSSKFELEELFETDNLNELNTLSEGEVFLFKYVGMLTINDVCLIIYPKYMDSYTEDKTNNFVKLKQLIGVIRKYESRRQDQNANIGSEGQLNSLAITLELIEDYLENGLYTNDRQIIEENGFGEILWEKTINESPVYFSNGQPLYLDLFTINQESNEQDFFRQLHRIVLSVACTKIRDLLGILDIDPIILTDLEINCLGSNEFVLSRINQELGVQFVTKKQTTLNLIKNFISSEEGSQTNEMISFVGTNSFNLVWEDVCSVVYEDRINTSIGEMGYIYLNNTKYSTTLADIIEKPVWTVSNSGVSHDASKTLTPDIVTIENGNLSIFDAKYYRIILDENKVSNNPGVGDVTKQYLYELAFREFAELNDLNIVNNAFLMPTDLDEEILLGSVKMDMFRRNSTYEIRDIDIILLPCRKLFEDYLAR